VYKWAGGPALVQTVDFFTPVVNDPYIYGQIAAANALSDVYAMGGIPRTALAIAGLPKDGPGTDVIAAIFRSGYDKLREADVALLSGHTVSDQEIKFGYAITGRSIVAHPDERRRARATRSCSPKRSVGIIATAIKFDRASESQIDAAVESVSDSTARRRVAPRRPRDGERVLRTSPGLVLPVTHRSSRRQAA
jgi:selenide,water dikinase